MNEYIVFFDFETGGIDSSKPEIQLAAIAVDKHLVEIDSFETKISFNEADADAEALKINHYNAVAWANAPSRNEVVREFSKFLKQFRSVKMISKRTGKTYNVARLAGHNAATFDAPRMRRMFEEAAEFAPFHPIPLDSLQLAMWKIQFMEKKPENLQLSTLCKFFGVNVDGAHDALVDVRLSAALTRAIIRD